MHCMVGMQSVSPTQHVDCNGIHDDISCRGAVMSALPLDTPNMAGCVRFLKCENYP